MPASTSWPRPKISSPPPASFLSPPHCSLRSRAPPRSRRRAIIVVTATCLPGAREEVEEHRRPLLHRLQASGQARAPRAVAIALLPQPRPQSSTSLIRSPMASLNCCQALPSHCEVLCRFPHFPGSIRYRNHLQSPRPPWSEHCVRAPGRLLQVVATPAPRPPALTCTPVRACLAPSRPRPRAPPALSGASPYCPTHLAAGYDASTGLGWRPNGLRPSTR